MPFGKSTGTIKGYILSVAASGSLLTNHAGFRVSFEGTSFSTVSDSAGMWFISDVPAGTYTIIYEKDSFATIKTYSNKFVGMETLLVPLQRLYKILYLSVLYDSITFKRDTGRIVDSLKLNSYTWSLSFKTFLNNKLYGKPYQTPFILILIGKEKNISANDPTTYSFWINSDYPITDTNSESAMIFSGDILSNGMDLRKGDSFYIVIYAGGWSAQYAFYPDLKTSRPIYSGYSPYHSEIIKVIMPL